MRGRHQHIIQKAGPFIIQGRKNMDTRENVLIVDDDESTRKTLELMFAQKGYEAETAETGREAMEKAQEKSFNLAILDVWLPDMGGAELLAPLKKMHPDIALIIATGHASLETALQALNDGASAYIIKPLEMNQVMDKVKIVLQKQRLMAENRRLFQEAQRELIERQRAEDTLRRSLEKRLAAEEELRRRNRELALLQRANQAFGSILSLDAVLVTTMQEVRYLLDIIACSVWLIDGETNELVCRQATGPQSEIVRGWRLAPGEGLAGWAAQSGESLIVPDAQSDERHFGGVDEQTGLALRSILCVPLRVKQSVIGVLQVTDEQTDRFKASDLALLESLAASAAIAIENARLFEEEQKRRQEAEALRQASLVLGSTLDTHQILDQLLEQIESAMPYDSANVLLLEEDTARIAHQRGNNQFGAARPPAELCFPIEQIPNLCRMLDTRHPHIVPDTQIDPNWVHLETSPWVRAWAGAPIVVRDEVIGFFSLNSQVKGSYTLEQAGLLRAFAAHAAVAIQNADLYRQGQSYATELEQRVAERTRELEEANAQLQELDRLKSKFVSDVSHELRTPVTNIDLYLHLLDQKPGRSAHYLAVLKEQTERLGRLIEDFLNLSRLDLGKDKIEFAPVDLNEVIAQVIAAHQPRAETAGLELILENSVKLPAVWGEQNQLAQVVTNLLANAINYTPAGQVWVRAYPSADRGQICLEVQDTGMGIEDQDLPHIFERFYRGRRVGSSNIPGTGLGLAIVKEIVDLHEGEIEVKSQTNQGSTFRVWLPVDNSDLWDKAEYIF
jgi:signal transduction histidine kinase/DNA-binding response OmpR family regulator